MAVPRDPAPNGLSDDELLAAITRDLRSIYSEIIRQPLPSELAAALEHLEARAVQPAGQAFGTAVQQSRSTS